MNKLENELHQLYTHSFLRLFRLRHESLLFNEHSVVGDLETTRWREMFLLFNRKIFNRLGKMTKHFTHRTRVEGRTDRQNDAAEWPPFFATSTLQIFLVQASGAQGVIS